MGGQENELLSPIKYAGPRAPPSLRYNHHGDPMRLSPLPLQLGPRHYSTVFLTFLVATVPSRKPFLNLRETSLRYDMRPVPVVFLRLAFCPHSTARGQNKSAVETTRRT